MGAEDSIKQSSQYLNSHVFEARLHGTNHKSTSQKTEHIISDLEEGEIVETAQHLALPASNNTANQADAARQRHPKKLLLADPLGDTKPRKPLRHVSPNKKDGVSRKGHLYRTAAGSATVSSRSDRPCKPSSNVLAGELGRSKWVSEQHIDIGELY